MATSKRAPGTTKPRKRGKGGKKGGRKSRDFAAVARGVRDRVAETVTREIVGGVLLVAGLFFSAAFFSGRGAVLGEVGLLAATHLMGVVGFALGPVAAVGGLLLLVGVLSGRVALGVLLLLVAAATTLAARIPPRLRFSGEAYTDAGGVVGSGVYGAVDWAGGSIGAALALLLLYVLGLSLLTGITPAAAIGAARSGIETLLARLRERRDSRRAGLEDRSAPPEEIEEDLPYEIPPLRDAPYAAQDVSETEKTRELEIVLPGRAQVTGFGGEREVAPGEYTPPSPSLLALGRGGPEHDVEETSRRLTQALSDLGVEAQVVRAVVGPRVTRYELRLGSGVKVGKVRNLQQDIAYALAATEVRILAPIPGKSAVGVEVPNTRPAKVTLGDVFLEYPEGNDWTLPVGLGKDISGRAVFFDLADMPHLLVAGTTGSGKSVMLNALLTSLLLTTDPRQVKMVLIDPKRVELSHYARIPHLITPVVTDVKKAANALSWAVAEMERRYEVLERSGARSLHGYNARSEAQMPYVVIVIDELADLMMQAAAKVEDAVIRIAQKARAVGIHLVV
ncbi:MAG TPA: DNA translocase FtsK, partial [Rubrobacteraceae bacterium]|nr:DNA translocase FtsK [Rubrobacteraceae bacterium]